jgi:hypothetical protein
MSLRRRWSDARDRLPIGHRLHLVTPLRLSVAAVAAAAVLAMAVLSWPDTDAGPIASEIAVPSPSVAASESPAPSVAPSLSAVPTAIATPTASPAPTPAPTPMAEWDSLTWSDPFTPEYVMHLADVAPWDDGYVAVGSVVWDATSRTDAVFFSSPDGTRWSAMSEAQPATDRPPRHLAVMGDEVLAFSSLVVEGSAPLVWSSLQGVTWSPVAVDWRDAWSALDLGPMPASWDITQHAPVTGLVDVASGSGGVVVIGNAYADDGMAPVLLHSVDGRTWSETSLPADSPSAMLNSVVARAGGFVAVGAVGIGPDTATAMPAAWTSNDGVTWTRTNVEGNAFTDPLLGGEFGPLLSGADGLVTCRGNREMGAGGPRFWMPFLSADGTRWDVADDLNGSPACGWAADDGRRLVVLGPSMAPIPWPGLSMAWVSTDGANWTPMELSATLPDMLERFWVVPDGVIYAGVQSFWFGTPEPGP